MFDSSALCPQNRKIFRFNILVCQSVGKVARTYNIIFCPYFHPKKLDGVLLQKNQMSEERLSLKTSNSPKLSSCRKLRQ